MPRPGSIVCWFFFWWLLIPAYLLIGAVYLAGVLLAAAAWLAVNLVILAGRLLAAPRSG